MELPIYLFAGCLCLHLAGLAGSALLSSFVARGHDDVKEGIVLHETRRCLGRRTTEGHERGSIYRGDKAPIVGGEGKLINGTEYRECKRGYKHVSGENCNAGFKGGISPITCTTITMCIV